MKIQVKERLLVEFWRGKRRLKYSGFFFFFITQLRLKAFAPHLKHNILWLTRSHLTTSLCEFQEWGCCGQKPIIHLLDTPFLPKGIWTTPNRHIISFRSAKYIVKQWSIISMVASKAEEFMRFDSQMIYLHLTTNKHIFAHSTGLCYYSAQA